MKRAYYMQFTRGHNGAQDRAGGLPTHLPDQIPVCADTGEEMCFLMQLYAHPERLPLPGVLALQLYQCCGLNEGEDPFPSLVEVPIGARSNDEKSGRPCPTLDEFDVQWMIAEDPDEVPLTPGFDPEEGKLYQSKLGGAAAFPDVVAEGETFLGQIAESPVDFNFGETMVVLIRDQTGRVRLELA